MEIALEQELILEYPGRHLPVAQGVLTISLRINDIYALLRRTEETVSGYGPEQPNLDTSAGNRLLAEFDEKRRLLTSFLAPILGEISKR